METLPAKRISGIKPMSPEWAEELALRYHLMNLSHEGCGLKPRDHKTVELSEVSIHLKVGKLDLSYRRRSIRCTPFVWFLTTISQLFCRSHNHLSGLREG